MGWSVGRVLLVSLAVSLSAGACAAPRPRAASAVEVDEMRTTLRSVYEAVGRGDEEAYRALVRVDPADDYSDALTTTMFESIRLHQAVEKRFDGRTASRPSTLAAVDYRLNAQAMIAAIGGWTFTILGDRATIDALANRPAAPALRRDLSGRWILVPTRWGTPRDTATYRAAVAEERTLARALAAARDTVSRGEAKSIEDVNDVIRRHLTQPATQPQQQ
jgi:hypothetical protein